MTLSDLLTVPALLARTTPGFINTPTYNTPISNTPPVDVNYAPLINQSTTPISNTLPVDVNYAPLINQSTTPTYGGTTGSSILNALGQGQAQATGSNLLQSLLPGLIVKSLINLLLGKDITTGYGGLIGGNLTSALTEGQAGPVGNWAGATTGNVAENVARSAIKGTPINLTPTLAESVLNLPTGPGGSVEASQGAAMASLLSPGLATGFAAPEVIAAAPTISSLAGGTLASALSTLAPVLSMASIPIMGMIGGALGWGDEASRAQMGEVQYRRFQAVAPALQTYISKVQSGEIGQIPEIDDYIKTLQQQKSWYDAGMTSTPGVAPSDAALKAMVNNQIISPYELGQYVAESYPSTTLSNEGQQIGAGPFLETPKMTEYLKNNPTALLGTAQGDLIVSPEGKITGGVPMYNPNAQTTWSVMGQEHADTYTGTMKQRYGDLLRAAGYNPDVPMSLDLVEALERKAISSSNPNEMGGP